MQNKERILFIHNAYQHRGGEDSVVEDEIRMLTDYGHDVLLYRASNDEINSMGKIELIFNTFWSSKAYHAVKDILIKFKPDVCHIHNTFPIISPSIYWAISDEKIPIVQTLHNFRLACPQAMFLRNSSICEDCSGKIPWRGVVRACYRESHAQTAVLASMITFHRKIKTWSEKIDLYIALNDFCKRKFIEAGLPEKKLRIKPNFIDNNIKHNENRTDFSFIGRLSKEKGVQILSDAAKIINSTKISVAGSGPEIEKITGNDHINYLGQIQQDEILKLMSRSIAIIVPSIWYENFPRTVVEAMSCGTPIIASRIGALESIIIDGYNGLLFKPGDPKNLSEKIMYLKNNKDKAIELGNNALKTYKKYYSKEKNYLELISIYQEAINQKLITAQK